MSSLLEDLLAATEEECAAAVASLDPREALAMHFDWQTWGRDSQQPPPGQWRVWLLLAGRGAGKTRTGAEWVRQEVESGRRANLALVGATAADVRDFMVEGDGGLLKCCPPWCKPEYQQSRRRLVWPNGAQALTFSSDDPDQLRGPNRDGAWADELAKWKYPREAWDNLEMILRSGNDPRVVVSTTPRPLEVIRELVKDPQTVVTRGSTYENVDNLAPSFLARMREKYEGTRVGRQELYAELLEDADGALWKRAQLDALRVKVAPELTRVVVAIDPATTSGEHADETGIVVAGKGVDGHAYVLADRTCRMSPDGWARRAVAAFEDFKADRVVAEVNNGGEMVEHVLRTIDPTLPFKAVHASRGKRVRAEPIAAVYEQERAHHVGSFPQLEDQQCMFTPDGYDGSPDRVDALVWALTDLLEPVRRWGVAA